MKVLFVLAFALVQGLALSADIEISNLPSEIESSGGIEISNLPAEVESSDGIEISHLPAEVESSDGIEISHLPAEIESSDGIEISHLPAEVEATPNCVVYVRALLKQVLRALPGGDGAVQRPSPPVVSQPAPVEETNACTRCFQKLQLLIEKANSRNSAALTF